MVQRDRNIYLLKVPIAAPEFVYDGSTQASTTRRRLP